MLALGTLLKVLPEDRGQGGRGRGGLNHEAAGTQYSSAHSTLAPTGQPQRATRTPSGGVEATQGSVRLEISALSSKPFKKALPHCSSDRLTHN